MQNDWKETDIGNIPAHWIVTSLDVISGLITDGSHFSPKGITNGRYMASVKDMTYDRFDFTDCKQILEDDFQKLKSSYCSPQKGDILISKDGANCLDIIFVFDQEEEIVILSSIAIVRLKPDYDPHFYRYYLLSPIAQGIMRDWFISGSAIPRVVLKDFRKVPVPQLPYLEQKAIAAVLSSFDDKIELLRRQNKTLETIAQTIFKEWFVKNPDRSWRKRRLGDVAVNIKCGVSAERVKDHDCYVGLEHIERKHLALYNWGHTDELESNKSLFSRGDILFGKLRVYFHKVCFAPVAGICSTDILVIRPVKPTYFAFCLLWFFSEDVVRYADGSSTGTRMPRANWDILARYEIWVPDDATLMEFDLLTKPMIAKIEQNVLSIQSLSELRDLLLPKLMKGEIRVKDTDNFVEKP